MSDANVVRVAVVDDDEWVRTGRVVALGEFDRVDVVGWGSQTDAMSWTAEWDKVDVALVDAHDDDDDAWDRLAGVAVVEQLRRRRPRSEVTVVIATGRADNDILRIRMAEAGADYLFSHRDLRTRDLLLAAVLEPAALGRRVVAEKEHYERVGLGPGARVNDALRYVSEAGLAAAMEPGLKQTAASVPRRRIIRARGVLGGLLQLRPDLGSVRARPTTAPAWRRVVGIVDAARGADAERSA